MVCCCYCIILRGRLQCRDDLEWPPLVLWPCSAEELFYISRLSRSAERSKRIFTGGVVEGNGSCRACFLRKQSRGGQQARPLRHGLRRATSPKGRGLGIAAKLPVELQSVRFRQSLSLWERWHRAAMTERASLLKLAPAVFRHDTTCENAFGALRRARQTRNLK